VGELRIKMVAGVMFLALAGMLARAFDLQAVRSEDFERELRVKRSSTVVVHPKRGTIRDRNGKILAEDRRSFDLYVELDDFEKNESVDPQGGSGRNSKGAGEDLCGDRKNRVAGRAPAEIPRHQRGKAIPPPPAARHSRRGRV
jgi:cell division protein FtsI/penicillin-binding protein 2